MTISKRTCVLLLVATFMVVCCGLVFGQDSTAKPGAAMTMFGMTPELFQDRAVAWVKAISETAKSLVGELGAIAALVLLLIQNIKTNSVFKDTLSDIKQRQDHQEQRQNMQGNKIAEVALAVPAASKTPQQVEVVNKESHPVPVKT